MFNVFILQGISNKVTLETVVLGVYKSYEAMVNALNSFSKFSSIHYYFYEVRLIDDDPSWNNDQQSIHPESFKGKNND